MHSDTDKLTDRSSSNSHCVCLLTSSLLILRITQQTLAIMASSFHTVPDVQGGMITTKQSN